nr:MAG TPA: hypothetical protein [Caudoviricetes sp.]
MDILENRVTLLCRVKKGRSSLSAKECYIYGTDFAMYL